MSEVTKAEGYTFRKGCQSDLKALAEACRKFFQLVIPVFGGRSYEEVRSVFINSQLEDVPEDFERLVELKEADSLHTAALAPCRDPLSWGQLVQFRKLLGEFLTSLSRHKDDPSISCFLKLENRLEAAKSSVERANEVLKEESPELVKLKISNDEITELNTFYLAQSSWCKWETPRFVLNIQQMADLKRKLLTRIEEAQVAKSQREDEFRIINKSFLESKALPKISSRTWHKFLKMWHQESHNLKTKESRINALKSAVSSESDKSLLEHSTSEEEIFDKLYMRYGTRLQVSEKLIGEIENTKPPSANTIENFLISIIIVAEYVEKERQTVLITPEKVTKIVSNTLDNSLALEWARLLFKLKEDCKSSFVTTPGGLSFEEAWQTTFGAAILNHLKNWCQIGRAHV